MTEFIPAEKGVPVRMPSTANLLIDSADRPLQTKMNDFYITKNASLLNGFFTRLSATEVVLEWDTPNILTGVNDTFAIIFDPAGPAPQPAQAVLAQGFYTIAEALDEIVAQLNVASAGFPNPPGNPTFAIALVGGQYVLRATAPTIAFTVQASPLQEQLFPGFGGFTATSFPIAYGDLRPTRYIDFVSPQLTYNQDVKDSTSAITSRDVVVRWYFAYGEEPTAVDAYNMPILMGYTPFFVRRTFNPPKQIKWSANQPIGQLQFQLFNSNGTLLDVNSTSNWLMTIQVSEV